MTAVNAYATLAQFKLFKDITSTDSADDGFIEDKLTEASRLIDAITGKWFYAATLTRYFDLPQGRLLKLNSNEPLLAATTLTNGDGTVIASTEYNLLPLNYPSKNAIELKASSAVQWQSDGANTRGVISLAGTFGYVDRAQTDPISARLVYNTQFACLEIAFQWYQERPGNGNSGGDVTVTAAGVVITPFGRLPKSAWQAISSYIPKT